MDIKVIFSNGMRVAFEVQTVHKALQVFLGSVGLYSWGSSVQPYSIFEYKCGLLKVLQIRRKVFSPSQRDCFRKRDSP